MWSSTASVLQGSLQAGGRVNQVFQRLLEVRLQMTLSFYWLKGQLLQTLGCTLPLFPCSSMVCAISFLNPVGLISWAGSFSDSRNLVKTWELKPKEGVEPVLHVTLKQSWNCSPDIFVASLPLTSISDSVLYNRQNVIVIRTGGTVANAIKDRNGQKKDRKSVV